MCARKLSIKLSGLHFAQCRYVMSFMNALYWWKQSVRLNSYILRELESQRVYGCCTYLLRSVSLLL